MTDAQVSQVATEVIRTNLAVDAQVSQVAVEVLRPNAAKGISASAGSYVLTGQTSAGTYRRIVSGATGTFTQTGVAAAFSRNYRLTSAVATFTLTGQDANLKRPGKLFAETGTFVLTGSSAILGRKLQLSASVGTYVLTGVASTANKNRKLLSAVGAFTLTGNNVDIYRALDVIDPVSGITIYHRLRPNTPAYANADAAYNAWAATLGVDSTGTDYTVTADVTGVDLVPLDQPILDGSVFKRLNLPHSGALGLYMSPPVSTTASSVAYSWGYYSLGYLMLLTDRPAFTIRAYNNLSISAQYQNTNLKLRKAYNPSTGVYEVIVVMTSSATTSPRYPIRCAYRLANGYIEGVFTVEPADLPAAGYFYVSYIVSNETSDIVTTGEAMLSSTTSGTFGIISDDYSYLRPFVSDTFAGTDVTQAKKTMVPVLSDVIKHRDPIVANWGVYITDTVASTGATSYAYKPGAVIDELFNIAEVHAPSWKFSSLFTDRIGLTDALLVAFPETITDDVALTELITVFRGAIIAELLGLVDTPHATAEMATQLVEALSISDELRRFLGGAVSDSLTASDTLTITPLLGRIITEALNIADTAAGKLIFRVTADDAFNLDDATPAHWIFNPEISETVTINVGYIAPNGSFTTWAINTRTGAVTEYQNFNFNSFGSIGHKYLGTSSAGLYELDGDDDAGTDVIAQIKSGYSQFGGSRYSSFKAAYLGMRANGNIIFKLDTGDGKSYTYETVAQDMQSTKVRLGKGLRARYFSFELISTGQDFDLDTVELLPLVAQRRV